MKAEQLPLPESGFIEVRKSTKSGWETVIRQLPNGHTQVITVKRPPAKK